MMSNEIRVFLTRVGRVEALGGGVETRDHAGVSKRSAKRVDDVRTMNLSDVGEDGSFCASGSSK